MREIKFVVCIGMLFVYSGREVKCVDNIKNEMEIRESRNTCRKMPAYGETSRDATILKAIEKDAVSLCTFLLRTIATETYSIASILYPLP